MQCLCIKYPKQMVLGVLKTRTLRMMSNKAGSTTGTTLRDFLLESRITRQYMAQPGELRSSDRPTSAANPRNLVEFREWPEFYTDLESFYKPYLDRKYDTLVCSPNWKRDLRDGAGFSNEAGVKDWAAKVLEDPCRMVIRAICGPDSRPLFRGRTAVNIGNPDRVLTFLGPEPKLQSHKSRVLVNQKTPWSLPLEGANIVEEVNKNRNNGNNPYFKSVHQLYGHMTMNSVKYGILTTVYSTRVLRIVHDDGYPNGVLECSPEIDIEGHLLRSPLAAFAYVSCLSSMEGSTEGSMQFINPYREPPSKSPIIRPEEGRYLSVPIPGSMMCTKQSLSADNIRLQLEMVISGSDFAYTARGTVYDVSYGLSGGVSVVVKLYDLYNPRSAARYARETMIYDRLLPLQGNRVPRLYLSCMDWCGGFGIHVLEDCGENMESGWQPGTKELARAALLEIHDRGVLHRDVALSNITYNPRADLFPVRIIDFREATLDDDLVTDEAKWEELEQFERLGEPEEL